MSAYVIFTLEHTTDAEELRLYAQKAPASRGDHEITPLVFRGEFEVLEGDPFEAAVVLRFPNRADAHNSYTSPAYQEALQHRLKGAACRVFIVDGVDA